MIQLFAHQCGGNIALIPPQNPAISPHEPANSGDIRLEIRKDAESDFFQWFYFRVTGAKNIPLVLTITNAGQASYPDGWVDYRAVASTDRETWRRVETAYANGELVIRLTPEADAVWVAYFAPYSLERHADLIAAMQRKPGVSLRVPGATLDGRPIDLLTLGEAAPGKRTIWVTARQHPGETMAEWWMEGFLDRLTDAGDPAAKALRDAAVLHIVPNMNPDGSARGHLRTNARGINLNREWGKASREASPEVFHVQREMERTGVDLFLDVHGDEGLPYVFIAGAEGVPGFSPRGQALLDGYRAALKAASEDFQTEHGYAIDRPGAADLTIATHFVAHRFDCLAMTLEMPFKDAANRPDAEFGWSPARCQALGAANVEAMLAMIGQTR